MSMMLVVVVAMWMGGRWLGEKAGRRDIYSSSLRQLGCGQYNRESPGRQTGVGGIRAERCTGTEKLQHQDEV